MKLSIHAILYLLCASVVTAQCSNATDVAIEQNQASDMCKAIKECKIIVNEVWVQYKLDLLTSEARTYNEIFGDEAIDMLLEYAFNNVGSDDIARLANKLSDDIEKTDYNKIYEIIKNGELVYHGEYGDLLKELTLENILCAKLLCKIMHNKPGLNKDKIENCLRFIEILETKKRNNTETQISINDDSSIKHVEETLYDSLALNENAKNTSFTLSAESIEIPASVQHIDDSTFDNVTASKLSVEAVSNKDAYEESENTENNSDDILDNVQKGEHKKIDEDILLISDDKTQHVETQYEQQDSVVIENADQARDTSKNPKKHFNEEKTNPPIIDLMASKNRLKATTTRFQTEADWRSESQQHDFRGVLRTTGRLDKLKKTQTEKNDD